MFCWAVRLDGTPTGWHYAAVAVDHKMYAVGGHLTGIHNPVLINLYVFNTVSLRWKKLPHRPETPSMRHGHTAVLVQNTIYMFGGYPYCNVLYAFDVDTHEWFRPEVSGTVPEGLFRHSACVLDKVMYIYSEKGMHMLDTTTMVWSSLNTMERSFDNHSATMFGTKMFVFGGIGGWHTDDVRVYDTETNLWLRPPSEKQIPNRLHIRRTHSAFAYNGELYVVGGLQNSFFNDVWKFNAWTYCWKTVKVMGNGPSLKYKSMCRCRVGDRIILFGGNICPGPKARDELYILDSNPSLKTLCKLAVVQYGLDQSELPHDVMWELRAMTANSQPAQKADWLVGLKKNNSE